MKVLFKEGKCTWYQATEMVKLMLIQ